MTSGLPPHVMHDILEGALQLEIKCLLTKLIQEQKLFHLFLLNSRLMSFPCGDHVSDHSKPLPTTYFTSVTKKQGGKTLAR